MTCNLSRRTFFPVSPSEDKLVSSIRDRYMIGGMSEKNGGAYGKSHSFDWEFPDSFDYGKDGVDRDGSFESVTTDIIDLLPSDPFGMEISATFTALAGWVEDFETDRLNITWNNTLMFQSNPGKMEVYERLNLANGYDDSKMGGCKSESRQAETALSSCTDKFSSMNSQDVHITDHTYKESGQVTCICYVGDEGAPNDALLFALDHLGVKDLLSVEKVCKSLRSAIQNDVLLWKSIRIDQSLIAKINDDALLSLTNRAQGNLLHLSIAGCSEITDNGLKRVLESNTRLKKLNVAECRGLSVDGIVNNLKAFKSSSAGTLGINHLRIGIRYGITREHFEEIKCLVGTNNCNEPHYYHYDDDRAIDIEICPKCENLRPVYDCPVKSCQGKQQEVCKGCKFCIARCVGCGRCVNDIKYEEEFFLGLRCSEC